MKRVIAAIVAIACLAVSPQPARACFCILPEVSDSFTRARAVFLGEAIHVTEPKTVDEKAALLERGFTIKFKVLQSWKGVPPAASEFNILWLPKCYECLDLPRLHERYLVYANPAPDSGSWGVVSSCNRTVGVRRDSNLTNAEIDPYRDMKLLDVLSGRAFAVKPRRRV